MPRRDQRILVGLAVLAMALAVLQSLTGVSPDVLLAVPALLLLLPLLVRRYLGEEGLARLAARSRPAARRPGSVRGCARRAPRVLARGGRLIADSLAERGPPAPAFVR